MAYKETGPDDGFVITSFLTRRIGQLEKRMDRMAQAISYVKLAEALSHVVMSSGLPLLRISYDSAGDVLYVHF